MKTRGAAFSTALVVLAGWFAACGSSRLPEPTVVNLSVDIKPLHICEQAISSPDEAVSRVEEVRALPDADFLENCGLDFVATISEWHMLPLDLLGRIVHRASEYKQLQHWVVKNGPSFPTAVADIVAMDIIGRWRVGDDTSTVEAGVDYWKAQCARCQAPEENSRRIPIAWVIENTEPLYTLLQKVNKAHRLRCKIDTDGMPHPVSCEPIHAPENKLKIRWKSKTSNNGELKGLRVESCKGGDCRQLRKTTKRLDKELKSISRRTKRLKVSVYRERVTTLMDLPAPEDLLTGE